jgi:hypothetical protein
VPWRVVLRRLPGAAAGLGVLALSLAGCGQSSDSHQSLAAYVVRVNKLEAQLTPPLLVVSKAGREIGAQGPAPGPGTGLLSGGLVVNEEHARLLRAAETIHRLQRKLGAIPAPAGAQHLRALLLALMGDQESLTRQTAKLVIFLPGFRAALAPLAPAIRKLEAALTVNKASGPAAVAGVYQGKAAALRTFEGTVNGILAGVRRLDPPDVSVPQDRIEVRSLEGMSTAAGQLAPALAHGGQGTSQLLAQFDRAASSTTTRAAQQVQADAVKAYDARIAQLNQLAEAASRERARLVNPRRQAAR